MELDLEGYVAMDRQCIVELPSRRGKWNERRNSGTKKHGNGERKLKTGERKNLRKKNKKIKYLIIFMGIVTFIEHLFHRKGNIHICYFV